LFKTLGCRGSSGVEQLIRNQQVVGSNPILGSMNNLYHVLLVGAGGFVGSITRYLAAKAIDSRITSLLPYGTLVVNIIGSFILGLVFATTLKKPEDSEAWRLLLGVGFCGGFTTFSTFALENILMLQQKNYAEFIVYTILSLLFCLLGTGLGVWIGNKAW
jgi:fluoride exporter